MTTPQKEQMNDNAMSYSCGNMPMRGDYVHYNSRSKGGPIPDSREQREVWIITSITGDMVRAKCDGAEQWRQAHYTNRLRLISRKKDFKR